MTTFNVSSYLTPENLKLGEGNYTAVAVSSINVLFVGRSQSGKTAIVDTILHPERGGVSSGFSSTEEPQCHHLVVQNSETQKAFQLNIIDTPGLKEVRKAGEKSRRDNELLALAASFMKENIVNLNVVCFVTAAGKTQLDDIEVFHEIKTFLGSNFSKRTMMILTHCDEYGEEAVNQFEKDIREDKNSKHIADFCELGIFRYASINQTQMTQFSGLSNEIIAAILIERLKKIAMWKNILLDKLTSLSDKQIPIEALVHLQNKAEECMRQVLLEEYKRSEAKLDEMRREMERNFEQRENMYKASSESNERQLRAEITRASSSKPDKSCSIQ